MNFHCHFHYSSNANKLAQIEQFRLNGYAICSRLSILQKLFFTDEGLSYFLN